MSKKNLFILGCALIAFIGGYFLGIIGYYDQKDVLAILKSNRIQEMTVTIRGTITEISGQTLGLISNKENLSILFKDGTKIILMGLDGTADGQKQEIGYGDLKVGDDVYIVVDIGLDGKVTGKSITVFPRPVITAEIKENIPEKITPDESFKEWFSSSLKQEFAPQQLELTAGMDIDGSPTREANLYGYYWTNSDKIFYTALKYNNDEKSEINSYMLSILWSEKVNLTSETASNLLSKYSNLSGVSLKCEKKETNSSVVSCQKNWQDTGNNQHSLLIKSDSNNYVALLYDFIPPESENYKIPVSQ